MTRKSGDRIRWRLAKLINKEFRLRFDLMINSDSMAEIIGDAIATISMNRIHGSRVEHMFGFVCCALGSCQLIKEEDVGAVLHSKHKVSAPDWLLVLDSSRRLLIEVKNVFKGNPISQNVKVKEDYYRSLQNYANLIDAELRFGIYWSRWGLWTLNNITKAKFNSAQYTLSLTDALQASEMSSLGDSMIATRPPLRMRMLCDMRKAHMLVDDTANFTVGSVEIYSQNSLIEDECEKNLAFAMMLFGKWNVSKPTPLLKDGKLIGIEFVSMPEEWDAEQGFAIVGSMSEMISKHYKWLTEIDESVEYIVPAIPPNELWQLPRPGYKGRKLPLWWFKIQSNEENL